MESGLGEDVVVTFDGPFDDESRCRWRVLKDFQKGCAYAHENNELKDSRVKLSSLHETEEM